MRTCGRNKIDLPFTPAHLSRVLTVFKLRSDNSISSPMLIYPSGNFSNFSMIMINISCDCAVNLHYRSLHKSKLYQREYAQAFFEPAQSAFLA